MLLEPHAPPVKPLTARMQIARSVRLAVRISSPKLVCARNVRKDRFPMTIARVARIPSSVRQASTALTARLALRTHHSASRALLEVLVMERPAPSVMALVNGLTTSRLSVRRVSGAPSHLLTAAHVSRVS